LAHDGLGGYTTEGIPFEVRKMTHVDVTVPDGLLAALKKAPHEVADELRLAAAIHWYQQGALSMARAAETAGMTRTEFLAELARRRVDVFVVDEQDLARELGDA
jgi:predicted HTH domain antitoxin